MKLHLFLIAALSPLFLYPYEKPLDQFPTPADHKKGDSSGYKKSNSDIPEEFLISKEDIIILRDCAQKSSIKSNRKLYREYDRSKKMALQAGISGSFVYLVKTLANPHDNISASYFILAGSVFFLISSWETLKSIYNIVYYVHKRELQKCMTTTLTHEIEKYDK